MNNRTPCELVTWNGFYRHCRRLETIIRESGFQPDIIIAIGRGGLMPARILADFIGLMNLTSFKIEHYRELHRASKARVRYPLAAPVTDQRILLVDDVSDTGDTFDVALSHIRECGTPLEIRTAVLHHKLTSSFAPDFYAQKVVKWRWIIYPWAVTEDLSTFLNAMEPRPITLEEAAEQLRQHHGIRVPHQILETVINMMHHQSG